MTRPELPAPPPEHRWRIYVDDQEVILALEGREAVTPSSFPGLASAGRQAWLVRVAREVTGASNEEIVDHAVDLVIEYQARESVLGIYKERLTLGEPDRRSAT